MEKQIGKITFTKGHVTITDPCYSAGTWCTAEVENVFKGDWEASVKIKDCGMWGNRVAYLKVKALNQTVVKTEVLPDDIGVDAGMCGVFEDKPDYIDADWDAICDLTDRQMVLNNGIFGVAELDNAFRCVGVWSASGYGDGGYTATVGYNSNNEVVEISIDYDV